MTNKNILLGVTGGIAAYKACEVARLFIKQDFTVHVMMTAAAQKFVTAMTFQALTGKPVATDFFDVQQANAMNHIRLGDEANVVLIAPATADILAKAAHGFCDDIVTSVLLATKAPIVFAPSMNVNMYENAATQNNIATLKKRGCHVIDPGVGALACGWEDAGRLAEPEEITEFVFKLLGSPSPHPSPSRGRIASNMP